MNNIVSITASIVLYKSNQTILLKSLHSLIKAYEEINTMEKYTIKINIIDNSPSDISENNLIFLNNYFKEFSNLKWTFKNFPNNPGFSFSHNFSVMRENSDIHLILNPDIYLASESLKNSVNYLLNNPNTNLVFPRVYEWQEELEKKNMQYLIKSYPSIFVLFLRGFAPSPIKYIFKNYIDKYENKDLNYNIVQENLKIVSGCFMLTRTSVLKSIGGFNEKYFLYFEDFDLSLRIGKIDYLPNSIVYHKGGNASKKGIKHIIYFLKSMIYFFNNNGWKLY
jgi:GT2 family glycosyltransferase